MDPIEFTWTNARGLKIFGQEWRPQGAARGVVALVHGLGEHTGRYSHVAAALNAAGYGMLGFELPGHGRSEGKRGHSSYDEALEQIDALLREAGARYPDRPRYLYGHSLGGALVLYYALKRRPALEGFIATSPGFTPGKPVPRSQYLLGKLMAAIYPAFTMPNGLDANYISRDPAVVQAYRADPLVHPHISARLALDLITKGQWMLTQAADFPGPLLLVHGSQDRLVEQQSIQAFAKNVPADKLTYKVWDGLYHETHNEPEKTAVIQYMIDWIDRQAL